MDDRAYLVEKFLHDMFTKLDHMIGTEEFSSIRQHIFQMEIKSMNKIVFRDARNLAGFNGS
jgi:hypothetical protein